MPFLDNLYKERKAESDERYDGFKVEPISSIRRISEEAYLENPTWLGGDDFFACLYIDLDDSSAISFKHQPELMAKLYDYFTQNIVDFISNDLFRADYIDIRGDGVFGIFEGEDAVRRAFCAGVTFKTFFEKVVCPKFKGATDGISCKLALEWDKVLVKKIGRRGDKNNNEVWAGTVVNNAAKLASLSKQTPVSPGNSVFVISDRVHDVLMERMDFAINSCGHTENGGKGNVASVWTSIDCSINPNVNGEKAWWTRANWCDKCGDSYMEEILD